MDDNRHPEASLDASAPDQGDNKRDRSDFEG